MGRKKFVGCRQISTMVSESALKKLDAISQREHRPRAELIREAIDVYIEATQEIKETAAGNAQ